MENMSLRKYRILLLVGLAFGLLVSFALTYILVKLGGWGPGGVIMAIGLPILVSTIVAISYHNGKVTHFGYRGRRINVPCVDIVENMLYGICDIKPPTSSQDARKDKS
jgi:hypothetical protein